MTENSTCYDAMVRTTLREGKRIKWGIPGFQLDEPPETAFTSANTSGIEGKAGKREVQDNFF